MFTILVFHATRTTMAKENRINWKHSVNVNKKKLRFGPFVCVLAIFDLVHIVIS